ncbi:hypothetical protein NIES4074_17840 [Cylindrospermum sp. NIES-4074]|nr:hypothetical protein NIES4074_17840 [Cylindrospermum sp. NIES-4074]
MPAKSFKNLPAEYAKRLLSTKNKAKKIITILLIMQTSLMGIQATDRIQQGDSVTETLIWLINQCVPVLQHISRREEEEKKRDGLRPAKGDRHFTKK